MIKAPAERTILPGLSDVRYGRQMAGIYLPADEYI